MSRREDRLATCVACGSTVHRNRVVPHPQTAGCVVARTRRAYKTRGWARAEGWSAVFARAGVPVEQAPVRTVTQSVRYAPAPWAARARADGRTHVDVPEDGPWAPGLAVDAARSLVLARISAVQRAAAVRRMVDDATFRAAVATARALGGPDAVAALCRAMPEAP